MADNVPVKGADGSLYEVPKSKLGRLPEGSQILTPAELQAEKDRVKYSGAGGEAVAFGSGFFGGPTLSASDAAIAAFGDGPREFVEKRVRANEGARTLGELAGIATVEGLTFGGATEVEAPAAAMSLGRLARGAAELAPSRAVSALGRGVGRGVASLVGENAAGLAARTAQKAAIHGASGLAEGAAYGLAGQASEDMLGDHDLVAEKYLAAAKHGAEFGGVLGSGIGAAGELGKAAFIGGAKRIAPWMEKEAVNQGERALNITSNVKAAKEIAKLEGGAKGLVDELHDLGAYRIGESPLEMQPRVAALKKEAGEAISDFRRSATGESGEGPKLSEIVAEIKKAKEGVELKNLNAAELRAYNKGIADIEAAAGFDPNLEALAPKRVAPLELMEPSPIAPIGNLNAGLAGETESVLARRLTGEDLPRPFKIGEPLDLESRLSSKEILPGKVELATEVPAPEFASENGPIDVRLDSEARANLIEEHNAKAESEYQSQVSKHLDEVAANRDRKLTFEEAANIRKKITDKVKDFTAGRDQQAPEVRALRNIANVIEDKIEEGLDAHFVAKGALKGEAKAQYKKLKLTYGRLAVADKALQKSVEKLHANRMISPTDYAAGIAGAAMGHPSLAIGLSVANKLARERGNSTASILLRKAAKIGALSHAANAADKIARASLDAFFSKASAKAIDALAPNAALIARTPAELTKNYNETVQALGALSANPDTLMAHSEGVQGDIGSDAPKVSDAVGINTQRDLQYLLGLIPHSNQPPGLMPHLHPPQVSQSEMASFMRSVLAVNSPIGVLKDFANDRMTKEGIDALRACSPKFLEEVQKNVYVHLAELKSPLQSRKRSQLSMLLGVPVDAMQDQNTIMAVQNTYNPGGRPEGSPTQNSTTSHPLNTVVSQTQTSIQRAAAG